MKTLHYRVVYKNGIKTHIADFKRSEYGEFTFEYVVNDPKYEFPGFDISNKKYSSNVLWEQIAFRVPNETRYDHPDVPLEELLRQTNGRLVTDHFEFQILQG
ncbi:hypothetical protein HY311_02740 [Candidatus Nomurabacteria bacterium]|nr:hypothetical protein [Candidatus Nomurabacteria bacterium]